MFRKLRNRFLILHMGIVILLMLAFFFSILVINYRDMENRSIRMLEEESRMPPPMMPRVFSSRSRPFGLLPTFSIELSADNKISRVMSVFDLSEEFYSDITREVLKSGNETGKIIHKNAHFRYKRVNNRVVFLEITKDVDTLYNMAFSILWLMLPMLVVIFFLSLYFANRSIKPISEAFTRQQEFIADASHEIKTPLTTISANTELLMDMATEEQKKWLSYIQSETNRMTDLTNSLLYLIRFDSNKSSELDALNFSDILEKCLMTLEAVFYEKKIELTRVINPNICVYGSGEQIKRLILILLDNAIKYTSGEISVHLREEKNEVNFSVFNSGGGISEEDIKRIWDRFYRVDKAREHIGGFGLGLSIAKAIVAELGGKISVESKPAKGVQFMVNLPKK